MGAFIEMGALSVDPEGLKNLRVELLCKQRWHCRYRLAATGRVYIYKLLRMFGCPHCFR